MRYHHELTVLLQTGWEPCPQNRWLRPRVERYPFTVQTLSRRQFSEFRRQCPRFQEPTHPDSNRFESLVIAACVLKFPEERAGLPWDWDTVRAALPTLVADRILRLSGFSDTPDAGMVARSQEYLASTESRYDLLIMTAFDNYKLEDLLEMDPELWQSVAGLAYQKLCALGIPADALLNPEQGPRQQRQAPASPGPTAGAPRSRHEIVTEATGTWGSYAPAGTAGNFQRNRQYD